MTHPYYNRASDHLQNGEAANVEEALELYSAACQAEIEYLNALLGSNDDLDLEADAVENSRELGRWEARQSIAELLLEEYRQRGDAALIAWQDDRDPYTRWLARVLLAGDFTRLSL